MAEFLDTCVKHWIKYGPDGCPKCRFEAESGKPVEPHIVVENESPPTDFRGTIDIAPECASCGCVLTTRNRVDIEEFKDLCYTCYSKKPKHICVDFDGVLAEYDGWKGPEFLGAPRDGAKDFLTALVGLGYKVIIHTTRKPALIQYWLRQFEMWHLVSNVTGEKLPALCYIDDRGVCFTGDFDKCLEEVKAFLPYWRREKA